MDGEVREEMYDLVCRLCILFGFNRITPQALITLQCVGTEFVTRLIKQYLDLQRGADVESVTPFSLFHLCDSDFGEARSLLELVSNSLATLEDHQSVVPSEPVSANPSSAMPCDSKQQDAVCSPGPPPLADPFEHDWAGARWPRKRKRAFDEGDSKAPLKASGCVPGCLMNSLVNTPEHAGDSGNPMESGDLSGDLYDADEDEDMTRDRPVDAFPPEQSGSSGEPTGRPVDPPLKLVIRLGSRQVDQQQHQGTIGKSALHLTGDGNGERGESFVSADNRESAQGDSQSGRSRRKQANPQQFKDEQAAYTSP